MLKYRPELSRNIDRNNNLGVLAGVFAVAVVFLILRPVVPTPIFATWIGAQILCHVLRFVAGRRLVLTSSSPERYRGSVNFYIAVMVLSGIVWGMSALMAEQWGNILHQLVILAVVTGIVGGSISTISPIFPAFIGFISTNMLLQATGFMIGSGFVDFGSAPNYEYFITILIVLYLGVVFQGGKTLQKARVDTLDLQQALVRAKEKAEWASNAKTRFLSSVSHELRTPLNAIMGFAQLLELDETLKPKQHEQATQILHASEHLLALISQVLELSRIEAGDMQVQSEDFELTALSRECLELVETGAARNCIDIRNNLPACALHTDKLKLKQILLNLLSNAIKYNHPGGEVTLACRDLQANSICLQVIDTGPGIPKARQGELFQSFNRLGREAEGIEGVGIGLVISRELAQAIGGTVGFSSEEGQGSVFWVEIPRHFHPGKEIAPRV